MSLLRLKTRKQAAGPNLTPSTLDPGSQRIQPAAGTVGSGRSRMFGSCANPRCQSGWLHVWRSSSAPVFEGGWSCSFECTLEWVLRAVHRERDGWTGANGTHHHRIPLGLLMLEQGWITQSQLRQALEAQKSAGKGRLGEWLIRAGAIDEQTVTRALALQWSCPVLPVHSESAGVSTVMPRIFVDAFGALPLRYGSGRVVYLGFEESLDTTLALAVEQMTGLRVESGIVQESIFRRAHPHLLGQRFTGAGIVDAFSESAAGFCLAKSLESARAVEARLVRVHDCLWMRAWIHPSSAPEPDLDSVRDVVCSIVDA